MYADRSLPNEKTRACRLFGAGGKPLDGVVSFYLIGSYAIAGFQFVGDQAHQRHDHGDREPAKALLIQGDKGTQLVHKA